MRDAIERQEDVDAGVDFHVNEEWSSGDVFAGGMRIHYVRTGGDRPAAVLAHGLTDNGLCWTRVAQALQAQYDVVMVDARGHGQSLAPETGYSVGEQAKDVVSVIRALDLGSPVLIGHSMGGATMAAAAARYPEHARCVILEDPPWFADGQAPSLEERIALADEWRVRNQKQKELKIAEIIAAGKAEHPNWAKSEWHPWAESKKQVSSFAFRELAASDAPWQDEIRRILCPILLITGDTAMGALVTREAAAEAKRLWAKGRIVRIVGAGHSVRRDNFEAYIAEVKAFLAES